MHASARASTCLQTLLDAPTWCLGHTPILSSMSSCLFIVQSSHQIITFQDSFFVLTWSVMVIYFRISVWNNLFRLHFLHLWNVNLIRSTVRCHPGLNFMGFYLLFSCPVMSETLLRPHGLQHARPPCPSPSPEVCPKFMSIALMNAIQPCHLLTPSSHSSITYNVSSTMY